jgi:major membrane immunogen (membrane-anchored lipoprotein)
MKKLLLLSALLIFACSSDSSDNNISDGQYFFEIEFAGQTHRVQGTNSDMFTNGQNSCSRSGIM